MIGRVNRIRVIQVGNVLLVLALVGGLFHGLPRDSDYEIFLKAGQRVWSGEPIYSSADGIFIFKYHPVVASFFAVLSRLPHALGKLLFCLVQLGLWAWTLKYWIRRLFAIASHEVQHTIFLIASLSSLKMLWRELDFGQVNGMLFFGATWYFRLLEDNTSRSQVQAGVVLGILAMVKLPYAQLAPLAIYGGASGALLVACGSALAWAVGLGISGVVWGSQTVQVMTDWIDFLFGVSSSQYMDQENQGLLHAVYLFFGAEAGKFVWLVGVVTWLSFGLLRRGLGLEERFAWVLLGVNFLSPLSWWNQYILASPLMLMCWRDRGRMKGTFVGIAVILFFQTFYHYDLWGRELYNFGMQSLWHFWIAVLAAGLFIVTRREVGREPDCARSREGGTSRTIGPHRLSRGT